jgi:ribonucleoside-diphosphate reductase alpha chain
MVCYESNELWEKDCSRMMLPGESAVLDAVQMPGRYQVRVDRSRDALLTDFGRATLTDRYLMPGEDFQDLFARVASQYGDNQAHAQRLYDYMSKLWFMPSTPILSNGGTNRGLPISCFLNEANDSLDGILGLWTENVWLASKGGGIGSYWGNLRSIGEKVGAVGKTSGVIPFIRVMDSLTLAISQGSLRRGSAAVYLPVWHPEIEEFIEIRRPTGGDPNRKAPNLHHGIQIPDAFMRAVENDEPWSLLSPKDKSVVRSISARALWVRILTARIETGEPYLVFSDHVNNARPDHHKLAGLEVKTSNLCSEITLPTGEDHHGNQRTAVCCLCSLNLENWSQWEDEPMFIEDIMRFLDNVLQDFIDRAPPGMEKAKYAAMRERSVGLGVMGFHSFLQALNVPWESVVAKVWNKKIFRHIRTQANEASVKLAEERGACPDAEEYGGFSVRNRHLQKLLAEKGQDTDEVWSSITTTKGSVQHLDFLNEQEKAVYKTAFELDQRWIVEHAADRAPFICQSQSVNVFLPANVHKRDLHQIHFMAWKKGVKSLYYCRSLSIARADNVSTKGVAPAAFTGLMLGATLPANDEQGQLPLVAMGGNPTDYEECLACQ